MSSTDMTLAIFIVILIIIAIFLFILLKIFQRKRDNKTPETNYVNKSEPPMRSFVSLQESVKGSEKELNTGHIKEEMKPRPAVLQVEENANLKLEDTLDENEEEKTRTEVEKTVPDVNRKKMNLIKRQAGKKTKKTESTLKKKTKPEEKKAGTKVSRKKKPKKEEVVEPAINEPQEKSPAIVTEN